MPQAVASNVFHIPFTLIESQPLPDGLRVQRLPIYIYGEIGFVKTAVKLLVGEPKPVHVLLQIVYQRIRQRNVADGCLCLWHLFIVAELFGVQSVTPYMYDLFVKVDVRPFQAAHLTVADARQKDKLQDDFLVHFVIRYILVQLSQEGARVIKARYEFARELKKFAAQKHGILSGGKETLSVEYESDAPDGAEGQIAEVLSQKLFMSYEKDCSLQYTTVGPHKDDIKISLDGVDVRKFGSQGQQRTAALSLKLAEISLFKDNMGEEPVLLLDDVLSELDEDRRKTLLQETSSFQTIITCTEYNEGVTPSNIIKIG